MAYLYTPKLDFPLKNYKVNASWFRKKCTIDNVFWGLHLGEDCNTRAGTKVLAIGRGKVVYSALHSSNKSPKRGGRRNWGNIVIIAHKNPKNKKVFFSLYGHLAKRLVGKGDRVDKRKIIGRVAKGWTKENGWWSESHLHFALYKGPWERKVLPGYFRKNQKRTKLKWWLKPSEFIRNYAKKPN
jgi:murein DD-endopeptidase MepM/ murein hydrolase activator NlpD